MPTKDWNVYIIETECGKLYTGIAKDVDKRFQEHKNDPKKGAKFFRSASPKAVVYRVSGLNRSQALKMELKIKDLSKKEKKDLIASGKVLDLDAPAP